MDKLVFHEIQDKILLLLEKNHKSLEDDEVKEGIFAAHPPLSLPALTLALVRPYST